MFRSLSRLAIPLLLLAATTILTLPAATTHRATATALPSYAVPYPSTVTINAGECLPTPIPSGMTQQNNPLVSWLDKTLNINVQYTLSAPCANWNQKVALALASGTMPDMMLLSGPQALQQVHELANAGMIEDLSTAFKSFSPWMQAVYRSDPQALQASTINGKLMAFPDIALDYQYSMLWVRQDWLDQLHLPVPKTVADIENVASAFIQHKMGGSGTVGLAGPAGAGQSVVNLEQYNGLETFDPLINAYGGYQGDWIVQNGKVVYGSTLPGMKDALAELHKMYAAGLIDPQFVSRTANDDAALIDNGKTGLFFGPWWMGYYPLNTAMVNNPKANWVMVPAPLGVHSGKFETIGPLAADSFLVVRKGFAHPEALAKMNSVEVDVETPGSAGVLPENPIPAYTQSGIVANNHVINDLQGSWQLWPLYIQVIWKDNVIRDYNVAEPYIAKHDRAGLVKADGVGYAKWYDAVYGYLKNPDPVKNENQWQSWISFTKGFATVAKALPITHEIQPFTYYPSPTMLQKWSVLQKQESQTFVGIIVGQQPLSAFDTFVKEWHGLGGDQITKELQAQYKQQQS